MKKYFAPTIKEKKIELDYSLLAGSGEKINTGGDGGSISDGSDEDPEDQGGAQAKSFNDWSRE